MIDPALAFFWFLGALGSVVVASTFTPGFWRRLLLALIIAVFMTPALVVGHGVGITVALRTLLFPTVENHWAPADVVDALTLMAVVWIIAFAVGSLWAWIRRLRRGDRAQAPAARRHERVIALGSYAAFALLVAGSASYRAYAREYLATYGPFVVTVDTGAQPLKDIVTWLSCGYSQGYQGKAVLESGRPFEFPRRYAPALRAPLDCTIILAHPDLARDFRAEIHLEQLTPRTRVTLATLRPPSWSDERFQRIFHGEEMTPGGEQVTPMRRAEIAMYDDWGRISTDWMPEFCGSDFARIEREYLAPIAARRDALFLSNDSPPPPEDAKSIVLAGWKSSCDYHARRQ